MIRELTDLLMPRTCLTCGRQLGAQEKHLCIWCRSDLPLTWNWEQPHNPMADELNALLERGRADGESLPYVYAAALLLYHHENPYKAIPRALKYGGNLKAGRHFAAMLGRFLSGAAHFADVDLVVPMSLPANCPGNWGRPVPRAFSPVPAGRLPRRSWMHRPA